MSAASYVHLCMPLQSNPDISHIVALVMLGTLHPWGKARILLFPTFWSSRCHSPLLTLWLVGSQQPTHGDPPARERVASQPRSACIGFAFFPQKTRRSYSCWIKVIPASAYLVIYDNSGGDQGTL